MSLASFTLYVKFKMRNIFLGFTLAPPPTFCKNLTKTLAMKIIEQTPQK